LNKQFAVTIAISVLISAFNALTLSPALSALLLRPRKESKGILARFFWSLQPRLCKGNARYVTLSHGLIRKAVVGMLILGVFAALDAVLGRSLPSSFLPEEDYGYLFPKRPTSSGRFAREDG